MAQDKSAHKKVKVGLLGGTFNPPHYGHLILAQEAKEQFNLDKVVFMITYI
ncbi:MAG: nicotinate-nucleotide adenylyltransferase, partial [Spirochaetes bacterium]